MVTQNPPLMSVLWPVDDAPARALRATLLVVLGSLLMTLSAKVQVPFYPVPMTMQTCIVLLIGGAYGWRLGTATMLAYLAEGFVGLPVFAQLGAGPLYFAGPTGGYLIGFVLSAALMGWLVERGPELSETWLGRIVGPGRVRDMLWLAVALVLASIVPFVTGVAWLAVLIGFGPAIMNGLVPFIPAAILKAALAGVLLVAGWRAASDIR